MEPVSIPGEVVSADAPGSTALVRRQVGVRHNDVLTIATLNALHSRIFEAVHSCGAGPAENVAKVVGSAIGRSKHQDVRDVVEETRTRSVVTPVALTYPTGEEVERLAVVEQSRVEHRPVARDRVGLNNRSVVNATGACPTV
jgi:hypothetical protein